AQGRRSDALAQAGNDPTGHKDESRHEISPSLTSVPVPDVVPVLDAVAAQDIAFVPDTAAASPVRGPPRAPKPGLPVQAAAARKHPSAGWQGNPGQDPLYISSGASMPMMANALASTCRVAAHKAIRAPVRPASSPSTRQWV